MKKLLHFWLIAGVLLSGCETKETLVGLWQGPCDKPGSKHSQPVLISKGVGLQVEMPHFQAKFFADGTFVISSTQSGGTKRSLDGSYQLSGSQVELRVTGQVKMGMYYSLEEYEPDQLSIKGRLKGNRLSLNDEYGIIMGLFSKDLAIRHVIKKEYGYPAPIDFEKVKVRLVSREG